MTTRGKENGTQTATSNEMKNTDVAERGMPQNKIKKLRKELNYGLFYKDLLEGPGQDHPCAL